MSTERQPSPQPQLCTPVASPDMGEGVTVGLFGEVGKLRRLAPSPFDGRGVGRGWAALIVLPIASLAHAEGYTSRAEWLVYGARYSTDNTSPFNPDNRLIRQPAEVLTSELRPDLAWSDEAVTINLKPRLLLEDSSRGYQHDLWLNEGNLRWQPGDGMTLAAGREVLLWGPAQFWNPSNPFYTDNGKSSAKREVFGKTFARARWQLAEGWNLHAISQIDKGHFDNGIDRLDALKLDWVGSEASAALLAAAEPEKSLQWRGWAQWTVDDAWLLYGEAAWARRKVQVPVAAPTPTGWLVASANDRYAGDAVLGAAYTFENAWTLNAEYYHHGAGLSAGESADWNRLAVQVGPQFGQMPLAAGQLGAALKPGFSPLRRNYLGVQIRNGSDEKIGWNLRYTHGLDDGSGQVVGQLSHDLSNRWQIWGNVVIQHGGHAAEYGRWLESTMMLGVTGFLW